MDAYKLCIIYKRAHDIMRSIDGFQPQEAFDELLKYLFYRQCVEEIPSAAGNPGRTDIRAGLARLVEQSGWATLVWPSREFALSDDAIRQVDEAFSGVRFTEIDIDIRSAAIRSFLPPEIRKGLGIYLTPDDVVRMMVEYVDPQPDALVYDPACGSGTFLVETIRRWRDLGTGDRFNVYGSDKNPRMLLLAQLNLGHQKNVDFHHCVMDFLTETTGLTNDPKWPKPDNVDVIFTNPPFGVHMDAVSIQTSEYDAFDSSRRSLPSEVLFIERSLRLLKPGGKLAIVLPRSVINNTNLASARTAIDKLAVVQALVTLPPETFAATGTQTTTCVLFFKRRDDIDRGCIDVPVLHLSNIGYDSTGRTRVNNELPQAATALKTAGSAKSTAQLLKNIPAQSSLSDIGHHLARGKTSSHTTRLGDIISLAGTGKTPVRSTYTDSGLFILKVGNLTGNGIDWTPRDRNFVSEKDALKRRRKSDAHMLACGDIVLTSSAHKPMYIAKKVDIITSIPDYMGGEATFVGELLRLRVKPDTIDPFILLAYLRAQSTMQQVQRMIRGQTAHLMAEDLLDLRIPEVLFEPTPALEIIRTLLIRESELAAEQNDIAHRQAALLREVFGTPDSL